MSATNTNTSNTVTLFVILTIFFHSILFFSPREQVKQEIENYMAMMKHNREKRLEIFTRIKTEIEYLEKQCLTLNTTTNDLFPQQSKDNSSQFLLSTPPSHLIPLKPSPSIFGLFSSWKSVFIITLLGIAFIIFNICILLYTSHLHLPVKTLQYLPS